MNAVLVWLEAHTCVTSGNAVSTKLDSAYRNEIRAEMLRKIHRNAKKNAYRNWNLIPRQMSQAYRDKEGIDKRQSLIGCRVIGWRAPYLRVTPVLSDWRIYFRQGRRGYATDRHCATGCVQVRGDSSCLACLTFVNRQSAREEAKRDRAN